MEPFKQYYSIREVEQQTQVPITTLRYWESQFPQLNPRKDGHGNRYYTENDIAFIKQVKFIRDDMKITRIEAIKNELDNGKRGTDARQRAAEVLMRIRKELMEIRANL
ncbi:MAG: MerR family transcriptional regulator [Paludibacteraceae bacterium]|nr:MerR family transcriptional regulator [Candidatus Colicola equi]MCQ2339994.1 MerR family transcriptional regulator [Paludibacteraceae bacterium]